jgi:protein tyrosine/serine phosphatase
VSEVNGQRHLDWDGCFNVRDLGGLAAADGHTTRWGAVVRADAVDRLTGDGWAALEAHGVRTVIDLRNDDELDGDVAPRPGSITTLHVPLDGVEDTEFWDHWQQQAPPMYYGPFLGRFPSRIVDVLSSVARADDGGGVLIHCVGGRDRTGLITMLLLALAGVAPADIAEDHALSSERLVELYERSGEPDQGAMIEEFLEREGTTARELILNTLRSLDVEDYLRAAGLSADDLAAVRDRLLA